MIRYWSRYWNKNLWSRNERLTSIQIHHQRAQIRWLRQEENPPSTQTPSQTWKLNPISILLVRKSRKERRKMRRKHRSVFRLSFHLRLHQRFRSVSNFDVTHCETDGTGSVHVLRWRFDCQRWIDSLFDVWKEHARVPMSELWKCHSSESDQNLSVAMRRL